MTQTATVIRSNGELAVVEVSRKTVCEGCHNMSGSKGCSACLAFGDKRAQATAYNTIGAHEGDRVIVNASSQRVIGYAAAIFFLPIVLAFAAYFIASAYVGDSAVLFTLIAFIISFAASCVLLERRVRKCPDLEIVGYAPNSEEAEEIN